MGRTACTDSQCLYKGALYLYLFLPLPSPSQLSRGLRHNSAAAHLLRLWVRIRPGAWTFVCCECCVLSGRVLCNELITLPEESYRLFCIVVCKLETSWMRRPWLTGGAVAPKTNKQTVNEVTKYKHRIQNIESKHNNTLQKQKPRKIEQNIKRRK
jgi:hypothetical protein